MDPDVMNPVPTVEIKVNWQGAMGTLVVPYSARIIEVKLLISQTLTFPVTADGPDLSWPGIVVPIAADRQELSWEGLVLEDQLTVQSYNIPANATILVFNKIKVGISIVANNLYCEVFVYHGTTVGELKAKIHADYGVDVAHKVVRKENRNLDDRATLWSARVVEGTVLLLVG
ncbi:hypothetical protein ACFX2H_008585 [Malus domestica]